MLVTFSTDEMRLCDFTEMCDDVPAFAPLHDESTFEDFRIDYGILTWCDSGIEISPTYLCVSTHTNMLPTAELVSA